MASTVMLAPKFTIIYNTPTPGTILDLSCYTIAVELTPNVEEVDVGTWCAPRLTDLGRVTYSAVATLLWEPQLITDMNPHIAKPGLVQVFPVAAVATEVIRWNGAYREVPWGRFEIGQRVEVELPLSVLDTPVWYTGS